MRRALLLASLAALALAAPAAALLPYHPSGTAVGEGKPLKAYASIDPAVHLFGDAVTARVSVVADTKWVDPARVRVTTVFTPYKPVDSRFVRSGSGRFAQLTWTWTLRCLTSKCVPRNPDKYHFFLFRPARIDYVDLHGKPLYGITAGFPIVETFSEISAGTANYLHNYNRLLWRYQLAPVGAPRTAVSFGLLYWAGLALAGVSGLIGLAVLGRFGWGLLPHGRRAQLGPSSTLDRALALFFWARERGDDTLQRKALERVAEELETSPASALSEAARALAWSPEAPADAEVQAISERAHADLPPAGETA
ncbi:MAG TPA: hypothetical protein VFJ91_08205 [Gaiellaceae bacterium]|nr:hypothetical protein [Gaiellaceae bacterium]